jgi:hypothetical protein
MTRSNKTLLRVVGNVGGQNWKDKTDKTISARHWYAVVSCLDHWFEDL